MPDKIYINSKPYWHYATFSNWNKAQKLIATIRKQHKTKYFVLKQDHPTWGHRIYKIYFNKVRPGWS